MTQVVKRTFVGRGRVWAKIGSAARFELGNVDGATLNVAVDEDKVKDFRIGGAAIYDRYSSISSASLGLSVVDHNANNLAVAMLGTATGANSGTVTNEAFTARHNALSVLARAGATGHVVTDSTGSTTYTLNTDYQVTGAGIIPLSTGSIADSSAPLVDYSYPAQTTIEAFLSSVQEMGIVIDGLNDADSGKAVVVEIYRWKPSPSSVSLIADKFGRLTPSGEILPDTTITGTGLSQYLTITQVD